MPTGTLLSDPEGPDSCEARWLRPRGKGRLRLQGGLEEQREDRHVGEKMVRLWKVPSHSSRHYIHLMPDWLLRCHGKACHTRPSKWYRWQFLQKKTKNQNQKLTACVDFGVIHIETQVSYLLWKLKDWALAFPHGNNLLCLVETGRKTALPQSPSFPFGVLNLSCIYVVPVGIQVCDL